MEKCSKKTYIIFLIGFFIGVIGFASSFFMYINTPNPIEINYDLGDIVTSDTGLAFKSIDKSIHLDSVIPTLDKFGILEKGFSFSIKNNNQNDINYLLSLIDDGSTVRNSDIRYQLIKNKEVVGIYNLNEEGIIDSSTIKSGEIVTYTIKLWLDYNSEVKIGTFNKKIGVKELLDIDNFNKPVLKEGMIPVYYDYGSNSWYKTDENRWYSYEDGIWANAVTIKSDKRNYYNKSDIGEKILIEDINSMWVWIPRFDYTDDVTFVKTDRKANSAFSFSQYELEGFWFAKFESTMDENSDCLKTNLTKKCNTSNNKLFFVPNYPFATKMTMANMFYNIRKMEFKNNIYGFNGTGNKLNSDGTIKNDNNDIDIHMVKNSEWQAVAILADSKYGINKEINNNNSTYSGKSFYDNNEYDYNVFNKGESASTTGNVFGIYDMSGGKREYVMVDNSELTIFDKKSNSGFNTKVKDYYYNNTLDELTLKLKDKYMGNNTINNEPITRGGYKNTGNIFNLYGVVDYIDKISLETNSRACLVILKEE